MELYIITDRTIANQYSKAQIKRLLEYFGSFSNLQNAPQEEINAVLKKQSTPKESI